MFENHYIGHWKNISLQDVVAILDNLAYTCFWAAGDGALFQITSCWDPFYDIKTRSIVLCNDRNVEKIGQIIKKYIFKRKKALETKTKRGRK